MIMKINLRYNVTKYRSNTEMTIIIIELMAKGDSKKTNIRFKAYLSFSYRPKKKTNYRKLFERSLKYIDCTGTIIDNY